MIPVDLKGTAIEGVRGLMHPDVLKHMADEGPYPEGDYILYTILGGMRFTYSCGDN